MKSLDPKFITDRKGKKISVVLPMKSYEAMLDRLEESEDIKLYYATQKRKGESIPVDIAFKMIDAKRKSR